MCSSSLNYWATLLLAFCCIVKCMEASYDETAVTSLAVTHDRSIQDILDEPSQGEARFFMTIDREIAFNTSLAFMIPLISFLIPGAGVAAQNNGTKSVLNQMGVLSMTAFYILGGISAAVYIHTQILEEEEEKKRSFRYENRYESRFLNFLNTAVKGLPEAMYFRSCLKLAICEAHADPDRYGLLSMPFRLLIPANTTENGKELTKFQQAANNGFMKSTDCFYEYPCLFQPLDILLETKEYITNYLSDSDECS